MPETSPPTPPTAGRVAQVLRAFRRLFVLLLLFCLVTAGGLLVALQQEQGQEVLSQWLAKAFSNEESQLQLQGLQGHFPWELQLERLLWQDRHGNRLQVEQLRLQWSWVEIMQGVLRLQELSAARLHWQQRGGSARPVAQVQASVPGPAQAFFLHGLPPILIDHLALPQLVLVDTEADRSTHFALNGALRHERVPGNQQWLAHLQVQPLDGGASYLNLQARLVQNTEQGTDPELSLQADGQEQSGWLAAWSGLAAAQGVRFQLQGQGPLSVWQGDLSLQVAGMAAVQGHLVREASGEHPVWRCTAQVTGDPRFLGADWGPFLASPFNVEGELAQLPRQQWQLTRLQVSAPTLQWQGEGHWDGVTQQLQAGLRLALPQLQPLSPVLGQTLSGALQAALTVQGVWPRPAWQLTAQGEQLTLNDWQASRISARWQGEWGAQGPRVWPGEGEIDGLRQKGGARWGEAPWQWTAELQSGTEEALYLHRLTLQDGNTAAQWQGRLQLPHATGEGEWHLQSRQVQTWLRRWYPAWQTGEGEGEWSGRVRLSADAHDQPAAAYRLQLSLDGALSHLQRLPPALQTLLGERLTTQAQLQWQGRQGWQLEEVRLQGANLQAKGAVRGDAGWQQQSGQLQWQIPRLAPWSGQAGEALQGDLQGELRWEGALAAPRLQWTLHGTQWQVADLQWPKPQVSGTVEGWQPLLHGTIKAELPGLEQKTLPLTSQYRLQGSLLQLSDLNLKWPGGQLSSAAWQVDLQKHIASGRWQGQSTSPAPWLRWLSGDRLQSQEEVGGALSLQLNWQGREGKQQLQVLWEGQVVRGNFGMLDKATLNAELQDLWGEVHGRVDGKLNKLHWGNLQLRSAAWSLSGSRRELQFQSSGSGELRQSEVEELHTPLPLASRRLALKPIKQEPFDWQMQSTLQVDNKGVMQGRINQLSGHIGADLLQMSETAQWMLTPDKRRGKGGVAQLDLDRFVLSYGPARLQMHVHFDAQKVDMAGDLRLPLSLVQRVGGPNLQGAARAQWRVTGSSSQPEGEFSLLLDKIHVNEPALEAVPPATVQAGLRLEKGVVTAQLSLQELTSQPATAVMTVPVQVSFVPWRVAMPGAGALGGSVQADAQLAQFALMVAPGLMDNQKWDGMLNIALQLAGTVAAPEVNGTILVRKGSYENGSLGTQLKNIHLDARAQGRAVTIERLEADDGGHGRIHAEGQLSLDWLQKLPFHLQATLEKSLLVRRDEWQATVSGTIELRGNRDNLAIAGEVTSNEVLLYLADSESLDIQTVAVDSEIRNGLHVATLQRLKSQSATPISLDLTLHLPSRVFLRGRGLESEWQGDLAVRGMLEEPRLDGRIVVRRGYFEFLDQRFDLRKGIIAFDGSSPPQPFLDLEAESRSSGGLVAVLRLQGPAFNPTLNLGSDPELPQDELLSRILFNSNRQQLTPAQALGLAVAVEKLRTGGPGLLGKARDSLGIDRLEFGGESVEGGSVKAGKYLGENLLLGVERGAKQGSGKVSVELEVMPNVVIQTEMDETNKSGIGMNWKMDY
ncbi:MAG: translocation/assembly module TamB domain-containing protein [Magnetococcales bacterium]|nr:translocation/assembly module TamB domain-containing protein [Magnetococcales bacterium]MBF0113679.1 translocation/assembly module TamB domain-containing protein [Magnetococcales bacterium]